MLLFTLLTDSGCCHPGKALMLAPAPPTLLLLLLLFVGVRMHAIATSPMYRYLRVCHKRITSCYSYIPGIMLAGIMLYHIRTTTICTGMWSAVSQREKDLYCSFNETIITTAVLIIVHCYQVVRKQVDREQAVRKQSRQHFCCGGLMGNTQKRNTFCLFSISSWNGSRWFSNSSYLSALNSYPMMATRRILHSVKSALPIFSRVIIGVYMYIYNICFFPSRLLSSPFCSLSLLLILIVVTQIRGHIAGSSPPLPTTVRALHFLSREDFSSSLVDSRRIVLTHARRSQQLILLFFFFCK